MEIKRSGSRPSGKGPGDWFTGAVRIDPLLMCLNRAGWPARALRLSRGRGRRGIRIRWGRA